MRSMKCLSRKCMELTCEVHCAEVGQAACILAFTVASHSRTELVYAVDNADLQVKEPRTQMLWALRCLREHCLEWACPMVVS